MSNRAPVVVGVDGSDVAMEAVRWAADHAARADRPLVVLHAWMWPFFATHSDTPADGPEFDGLRDEADAVAGDAVAEAEKHRPGLVVTSELVVTAPALGLIDRSATAATVVIGSRGHGGFGGLLLGSVGVALAGHTVCPLVVVRGVTDADGPVLVGVDAGGAHDPVVELAFAEADTWGVGVRALHAWSSPVLMPDWPQGVAELLRTEERHARADLEAAIADAHSRHPAVAVTYATPSGSASHALVNATAGCRLVVVGARGRGGFRGLVLGSTSHALLHHAACPVMIAGHVDATGTAADAH